MHFCGCPLWISPISSSFLEIQTVLRAFIVVETTIDVYKQK